MQDTDTSPPKEPAGAPGDTQPVAEPTPSPEAGQPAAPELSLQQRLEAAEQKAAEQYDAFLRAKAETDNVRRRAQDEIVKASRFAVDKFAQNMLPVKDSLEAALIAESATIEALKAGVELTLRQLESALAASGVTEVNPAGEKFDPHRHQAISTLEADGESNRVVSVLQKGYLLHERVLRPALVVVSKARAADQNG